MPEPHNTSPIDFCILIPCYNNVEGLIKSLRSIHYDETKYLVVIVDDGSREPVQLDQLSTALENKISLHLITLEKNAGITNALNVGLKWIYNYVDCKYVARLDCGDTCHPDRFYKQVGKMNQHSGILLLGSWCRFVNLNGDSFVYKTPVDKKGIKRGMFFRNLFIHPTFMFRLLPKDDMLLYPENYPHAEDYAFAWQLMKKGEVQILPDVLVSCEINFSGISESNRRKQIASRQKVVREIAVNNILKVPAQIYLFLLRIIPRKLILAYKLNK